MHGGQRDRFPVSMAALLLARVPSSLRGGQDVCVPSSLHGGLLARVPSKLHGGLLALVPSNQTAARTPPSLVKFRHGKYNTTVCDIKVSAIFSKRTSLAINVCALSQTGRFFYHDIYVPCHETMPSFIFLGEFLIYWDLKTEILNVSG